MPAKPRQGWRKSRKVSALIKFIVTWYVSRSFFHGLKKLLSRSHAGRACTKKSTHTRAKKPPAPTCHSCSTSTATGSRATPGRPLSTVHGAMQSARRGSMARRARISQQGLSKIGPARTTTEQSNENGRLRICVRRIRENAWLQAFQPERCIA